MNDQITAEKGRRAKRRTRLNDWSTFWLWLTGRWGR